MLYKIKVVHKNNTEFIVTAEVVGVKYKGGFGFPEFNCKSNVVKKKFDDARARLRNSLVLAK